MKPFHIGLALLTSRRAIFTHDNFEGRNNLLNSGRRHSCSMQVTRTHRLQILDQTLQTNKLKSDVCTRCNHEWQAMSWSGSAHLRPGNVSST